MDLAPEELQFLSIPEIMRESISILKRSPKTFYLVNLTLVFPLSFAVLAHSLFTHPLLAQLQPAHSDPSQTSHDKTLLLAIQFCYLLSTAAIVFTVAPLYISKSISFPSTLSAIPKAFKCLFVTFLWVSLLMFLHNSTVLLSLLLLLLLLLALDNNENSFLLFLAGGSRRYQRRRR